jgi:predicted SAM-dependent methyltransferase
VRGIPFVLLQLGVAYLILRDALKAHDKTFVGIGLIMVFAMLCFATVLALGVKYPALQMLMFPKTVAYLLIGFVAYGNFYGKESGAMQPSRSPGGKLQKHHAIKLVPILVLVLVASFLCSGGLYMYFAKNGTTVMKHLPPSVPNRGAQKSSLQYNYTVQGARRTANLMGYEDTEINQLLQKYLEFVPQSPGNVLDLGCAWGFAIQQVLMREKQTPFLKPHNRKILAVDLNQEHLDRIAAGTPHELVETIYMHFPFLKSPQCKRAFSHDSIGATYAGLLLHYLNPNELTEGLKLLYASTAPGGRVFASVNSAFLSKALGEDFLRRKQNPADPFPGWYPNVFDASVPEKVRNEMPKSVCGMEIKFLHVFDEETLSRYFEQAGFNVLEHFYFSRSKMIPMKLLGIIAEKPAALSSVK